MEQVEHTVEYLVSVRLLVSLVGRHLAYPGCCRVQSRYTYMYMALFMENFASIDMH